MKDLILNTIYLLITRNFLIKHRAIWFTVPLKPLGFKGLSFGPVVWMYTQAVHDHAIIRHELKHVEQFYREPLKIIWMFLFRRWSEKAQEYNLELELEAYVESIRYGDTLVSCAMALSNHNLYHFKIEYFEAYKKLSEELVKRGITL